MTTTLEVNSHMAKNLQSMVASLASKIIQVSKASGLWSHLPSYCRQIRRLWRIRHRQHLTFHREKLRMQELTIRSLLLQEPLSLQAWLKELSKAWTETGRHQLSSVNSPRKVSKENSWPLARQSWKLINSIKALSRQRQASLLSHLTRLSYLSRSWLANKRHSLHM